MNDVKRNDTECNVMVCLQSTTSPDERLLDVLHVSITPVMLSGRSYNAGYSHTLIWVFGGRNVHLFCFLLLLTGPSYHICYLSFFFFFF